MAGESVQRRLVAILAADVVGYSRLMEQDEAGTLSAVKERRRNLLNPLVAQHHGRLVKVMGDGVLVEFASAVNAVAVRDRVAETHGAGQWDLPEASAYRSSHRHQSRRRHREGRICMAKASMSRPAGELGRTGRHLRLPYVS